MSQNIYKTQNNININNLHNNNPNSFLVQTPDHDRDQDNEPKQIKYYETEETSPHKFFDVPSGLSKGKSNNYRPQTSTKNLHTGMS